MVKEAPFDEWTEHHEPMDYQFFPEEILSNSMVSTLCIWFLHHQLPNK
jgi:hypothetical protein